MNFFFGVNNKTFKSELQIPLFKNRSKTSENLKLFKCFLNKKWVFKEIHNKRFNKFFYLLKNEDIRNDEIYFLAKDEDLEGFDCKKLKNFNNYTETSPSYRANFKIYLKNGGFSSYQSEYPFSMIEKKGAILTPINTLSNKNADKNYILIKNIFVDPIEERFKGYLINIKNKKILEEYEMKTNFTNIIELKMQFIKPEIFFTTSCYLGVPIFISIKNKFVSFEHTHPLQEYILSSDKFIKISELKKEVNEILN